MNKKKKMKGEGELSAVKEQTGLCTENRRNEWQPRTGVVYSQSTYCTPELWVGGVTKLVKYVLNRCHEWHLNYLIQIGHVIAHITSVSSKTNKCSRWGSTIWSLTYDFRGRLPVHVQQRQYPRKEQTHEYASNRVYIIWKQEELKTGVKDKM